MQRRTDPLRKPFDKMRPLIARNFNWMTDFNRVQPVGDEGISSETRQLGGGRDFNAARAPTGAGADQECGNGSCYGSSNCAITTLRQVLDSKPPRRRFDGQVAETLANKLDLLAPGRNFGGIVGMRRKPGLDGSAAI